MAKKYFWGMVFLIVITIFPLALYAEPTPTVRYLMDEPVSMFDLGLFRLNLIVKQMTFYELERVGNFRYDKNVEYNWDKNRIEIKIEVFNQSTEKNKSCDPKKICETINSAVKFTIKSQIHSDSNVLKTGFFDSIGYYFKHIGYKTADRPNNMKEEINNIVDVIVTCYYKTNSARHIRSRSPFHSDQISFSEGLKHKTIKINKEAYEKFMNK